MFPSIARLSDLLPFVKDEPAIRARTHEPTGLTVVCYAVVDDEVFEGENAPYERECRGVTFARDGSIVSRPLHKFFNVGERPSSQLDALDWGNVTRITLKRDGSMVTPARLADGGWVLKTKRSFDTPETRVAQRLVDAAPGGRAWIDRLVAAGRTASFEVTSPRCPIVLPYDADELTLLHVRENVSGRYLSAAEVAALDSPFPRTPDLKSQFVDAEGGGRVSWERLRRAAETAEGIEGWVIEFADGEMVKLKTAWYAGLHHAVTFTRWRDIARAVVEGTSDDLKAAFALTRRSPEPIRRVEHAIHARIRNVETEVTAVAEDGRRRGLDAKAMALAHREHPLFPLIMNAFRGKAIDVLDWYAKRELERDWGLEQVPVDLLGPGAPSGQELPGEPSLGFLKRRGLPRKKLERMDE
ncbi:MAG TPA: RNA ligase, partial [Candidatus Thermoplasmatota archaeon]